VKRSLHLAVQVIIELTKIALRSGKIVKADPIWMAIIASLQT